MHSANKPGKDHIVELFINLMHKNVIINETLLWDISNPDNSPEEFASQMVVDYKLDRTFIPILALQIRRQL